MTYKRPELNPRNYLDEYGAPIPYGRRWRPGSPPDDAYSVTPHSERFAPLLEVATALRMYLVATYDVEVNGNTIVPRDPGAASLTITATDFPGVRVSAGVTAHEGAWFCGCDACDDDVEQIAENLERFAFAVVNGDFQERIVGREVHAGWGDDEGNSGSMTPRKLVPKGVVAALKARGKDAQWLPWSLRA